MTFIASTTPNGSPDNQGVKELELCDLGFVAFTKLKRSQSIPRRKGKKTHFLNESSLLLKTQEPFDTELQNTSKACILKRRGNWNFNAFMLDRLSLGHSLPSLCSQLFTDFDLYKTFGFEPLNIWRFFSNVESGYHRSNPYHNGVHASDVTQAMNCFLREIKIRRYLSPLEILSSLIAAATHDLDHPGKNERFLSISSNYYYISSSSFSSSSSSSLTSLYTNTSVLENHHWRSALSLIHDSRLSDSLSRQEYEELKDLLMSMILATDISRQSEYLSQLTSRLDEGTLDLSSISSRKFILQIAIKCADISNPCRYWSISRLWSYRASEEFFRQGDEERELNMTVTPSYDRDLNTVAQIQTGFYKFVAHPLFLEWNRFNNSPLSKIMLSNLTRNHKRWNYIEEQEQRGEKESSINSFSKSFSESAHLVQENSDVSFPLDFRRRHSYPSPPSLSSSLSLSSSSTPSNFKSRSQKRPFGSEEKSSRVTFHLGNSLDETNSENFSESYIRKVAKIQNLNEDEEIKFNKENSDPRILRGRRGSAPSNLLTNQILRSKSLSVSRDTSPGSIIRTIKEIDPVIARLNYQRQSRLHQNDRRSSLPEDDCRHQGSYSFPTCSYCPSSSPGVKRSLFIWNSSNSSSQSSSSNSSSNSSSFKETRKRKNLLRRKSSGSDILPESSFRRRKSRTGVFEESSLVDELTKLSTNSNLNKIHLEMMFRQSVSRFLNEGRFTPQFSRRTSLTEDSHRRGSLPSDLTHLFSH